jgi:hypothetical protein
MLRISTKRRWRAALVGIVACAGTAIVDVGVPASAAAAPRPGHCLYPQVTYTDKKAEFAATLSAEVCRHGKRLSLVSTDNFFQPTYGVTDPNSDVLAWNNDYVGTGDGVDSWFWDPKRYGGSWTIWANVHVTISFVSEGEARETVYLRIWIKPNGKVFTFAGATWIGRAP